MKRILVTTDLSANSRAGIRFAIQFARQLNAELIFYHVAEVTKPTSWSDAHYNRFAKDLIEGKTSVLKDFVRNTIDEKSDFLTNSKFIVHLNPNVDSSIINTAKRSKADFICMSTRGAGKIKKLFGTNASTIITASPVPVVVVPQRYRVAKIDQLFFACDFAALKQEMKQVQILANKLNAGLKVFHYDYLIDVVDYAKKLDQKAEPFKSNNVSFNFKKLEIDQTLSDHLAKDIKKEKPSLVILFTKQDKNWFDRLLMPSEAAELSFNTRLPLLTFKKKI